MRQFSGYIAILPCALLVWGCVPQATDGQTTQDPITAIVDAATNIIDSDDSDSNQASTGETRIISGRVSGSASYQLFNLGSGSRGDSWEIVPEGSLSTPYVVVLFDADMDLIMRTYMSYHGTLNHVLRADTDQVVLGVMSPVQSDGGDFRLKTIFRSSQSVPAAARQIVYLNFGAGRNVRVNTRDPISFAPFDAAVIGDEYAGNTDEMKAIIVQEMRADYAAYDIEIQSSDDGPAPDGSYSTIHFGGSEPGLLGLADNVDNYNTNKVQDAMIYVENFSPYWTMNLTPEEMAIMIANVASHELGHLLGLYHTKDPADLMDTTGSAWELAANQSFIRGELERSVFATGYEHSPRLLSQILGPNKSEGSSRLLAWRLLDTYQAIRQIAREEIEYQCGTCQHLDHE